MSDDEFVTDNICVLRREIIDSKVVNLEERILGLQKGIQEVRDLQTKILYAIIGLFGTSIFILIGVIAGRAIDFRVLLP